MPNTPEISEVRRALLEKYLRGYLPQPLRSAGAITRRTSGSPTPLSFGQEQGWFLVQLALDSPVNNECVTIHLAGPLDVAAFEQSFNEIIRRHEAWRTSFPIVVEKLPEYMLPSAFMLLDALPLTPNGKIDRCALPAPESARHTEEETFVAPTSMVHYQLIQIWEELLDERPIGIRDNFFLLGGHSLLAVRLVNRIEQRYGKKIPLATLFAGPTIEQLASALQ